MANLFVGMGGFATIQLAVNAAAPGDTIQISNGTYAEQVIVNGKDNLTFIGESRDGVILTGPAVIVQTGEDHSTSGSPTNDIFGLFNIVNGADNINLSNITIDGGDRGFEVTNGTDVKYVGLFVLDSTGTIANNLHITDVDDVSTNPTQNTFSVLVDEGRTFTSINGTFTLTNSEIDGIGKAGIVMYDTNATITGNTITGDGPTGQTAQNGIQISGAGTISGNTISGFEYTVAGNVATGILIVGDQGLDVDNNTLNNAQVGIAQSFDVSMISTIDFSTNVVTNPDPDSLGALVFQLDATTNDLTIIGTNAVDVLNGSNGDDFIDGGAGADGLGDAFNFETTLGNDTYVVDNVGDEVFEDAASGTDTIRTSLLSYSIAAIPNVENLTGTLNTGQILEGSAGINVITAGDGNDVLAGLAGADQLIGNDGTDTASYADAGGSVRVNLNTFGGLGDAAGDTYSSIENVVGSDFSDEITGDGNANVVDGGDGDDTINAGGGTDGVIGGLGDDQLGGGAGDDMVVGGDGEDTIFGEAGNDQLNGGSGDDIIVGGTGDDIIGGEAGVDRINGEDGADTIFGGIGSDELGGGSGDDIIVGDAGNDSIFGETGNDQLNGGDDGDVVLGGAGDDVVGGGTGNDNLLGNADSDTIFGEAGDDFLEGGTENDILVGGIGDDVFVFRANDGSDQIVDFNSSGEDDKIFFIGTDLNSFEDVQDASTFDAGTGTTVIEYTGGEVTVNNAGPLTADHFLFG